MSLATNTAKKKRSRCKGRKNQGLSPHSAPPPPDPVSHNQSHKIWNFATHLWCKCGPDPLCWRRRCRRPGHKIILAVALQKVFGAKKIGWWWFACWYFYVELSALQDARYTSPLQAAHLNSMTEVITNLHHPRHPTQSAFSLRCYIRLRLVIFIYPIQHSCEILEEQWENRLKAVFYSHFFYNPFDNLNFLLPGWMCCTKSIIWL